MSSATIPMTELTTIVAEARWPESDHDDVPPALPGFIVSSFSPIAAEAASRCLRRRPAPATDRAADHAAEADTAIETKAEADAAVDTTTAVIIASARGDLRSATHVAATVDAAGLLSPLLFFQSVPNAIAGHIAARWNLTGPVVCVGDRDSALECAALLIEDGDADQALVLTIEQAVDVDEHDRAHAVLLQATPRALPSGIGDRS